MAFADWTSDVANFTVALSSTTPMVGSSYLRVAQTAITARYFVRASGGSMLQGPESGRLRTLIRANQMSNNYRFGLACLASIPNLAAAAGNWYAAFILGAGPTASVALYRGNAALINAGTSIATGNFTFAINTIYALQLDWVADPGGLGGTYLNVWVGAATDFSDLASVINMVDGSASKITSGNHEGLAGQSSVSTLINIDYDQTSLYTP